MARITAESNGTGVIQQLRRFHHALGHNEHYRPKMANPRSAPNITVRFDWNWGLIPIPYKGRTSLVSIDFNILKVTREE